MPKSCPWYHVAIEAGFATTTLIPGGYLLYTATPGRDSLTGLPRDLDQKIAAVSLLVASAAYTISFAYGYSFAGRCEQAHEQLARDEARQAALAAQREHAWALTRETAAAARAGDCRKVLALDAQVREADAELYGVVFRADVAISRCLAGTK